MARWRIIGYENRVTSDETFTQNRKKFAEIYSGASITVFYELELAEGLSLGQAAVPFEKIELRWVDPATGKGRKQSGGSPAALAVWGGGGFEGQPLAHLGGIVALVADRYGSLPGAGYDGDYREAHLDFTTLQEQLRSLERDLGRLDAYNDFAFLLEHITGDVAGRLPPSTPSGLHSIGLQPVEQALGWVIRGAYCRYAPRASSSGGDLLGNPGPLLGRADQVEQRRRDQISRHHRHIQQPVAAR